MKRHEVLTILLFLAVLGAAVFIAACTLVIGDRNKVEAPDVRAGTKVDIGKAQPKGEHETAPVQNNAPAK